MAQIKHRTSNFEVLRILSMCGIIAVHYMNGEIGGGVQNAVFPNFSWFFMHLLSSFCVPMVNCFVLISGYFLIGRSNLSFRKATDLLIITAYYGLIAYVISLICGNNVFSWSELFFAVMPFFKGTRWFVETYIILILLSPFLNRTLRSLNRNSYRVLILIQLSIFSVWYSIGLSAPLLDDGYGIINFITLYMLGAYLRLYGKDMLLCRLQKWKLLILFVGLAFLTFSISYFTNPYGYAFITNILGAAVLFILFMKWNIGEIKIINKISSATFDVYFVHSDKNTSFLLIYELLGAKLVSDTPWMTFHILFVILIIWGLGFCAYQIRKNLFRISVDKILDKLKFVNKEYEV